MFVGNTFIFAKVGEITVATNCGEMFNNTE